MILHKCQIFVNNYRLLVAGFRNGAHEFGWVDNQPHADLFADVFDYLAIKGIGSQVVQRIFKSDFALFCPLLQYLINGSMNLC